MRLTWLIHVLVLVLISLCAIGPFLAVAYAGSMADKFGCQLDEGSIHPCQVKGVDRGEDLYALGMLGWLGVATVPLGLAALVLYLAAFVIIGLVRRQRGKRAGQHPFP
jgi:hypothetical protein